MQPIYIFAFLLLFLSQIRAFPIIHEYKLQTIYSLERVEENNSRNLDIEYDVYQTVMDYYENLVDNSISSSSERLLLNLIHLPREELNILLAAQMKLIGLDDIPDEKLYHIPAIIGKHIHEMNAQIYSLIQPLVLKNWHAIGLSGIIYSKNNEEDNVISFMTSFNSEMAKNLLDEIRKYNIEEKIKEDVSSLVPGTSSSTISPSHPSFLSQIVQNIKASVSRFSMLEKPTVMTNSSHSDDNFLKKYINEMEIDLLIELHIQFYDFYTQVKADLQPPPY